jgi:hypothetical protein
MPVSEPGQGLSSQSLYIYKDYHGVCPLVGIGTPHPLSRQQVRPSPPEPKGGWGTLAAGEGGGGESQFRRLEKSLALCLLCACPCLSLIWYSCACLPPNRWVGRFSCPCPCLFSAFWYFSSFKIPRIFHYLCSLIAAIDPT